MNFWGLPLIGIGVLLAVIGFQGTEGPVWTFLTGQVFPINLAPVPQTLSSGSASSGPTWNNSPGLPPWWPTPPKNYVPPDKPYLHNKPGGV